MYFKIALMYEPGLDVAFDIFDKAKDGTGCKGQKIILFMTDGTSEDPEGVLKFIHARNQVQLCPAPHPRTISDT